MIDQAGQLDRRITIQIPTYRTDLYGQREATYESLADLWANVKERVGTEGENGDMIAATKKVEFIIRYSTVAASISDNHRVLYNNNMYKIQSIQAADARKAYFKLVCLWSDAQ